MNSHFWIGHFPIKERVQFFTNIEGYMKKIRFIERSRHVSTSGNEDFVNESLKIDFVEAEHP